MNPSSESADQPLLPPAKLLEMIGSSREDYALTGLHFLDIFRQHGGLKPTYRVLDVGCGCGRMALPLAEYLTTGSYEGFDVAPDLVAWCRENIASRHGNFHFTHANVAKYRHDRRGMLPAPRFRFPYQDGAFDFTFLTSVFTHMLPGSFACYAAEVARTLKTGGTALMTFFILNDESRRLERTAQSSFRFRYPYWRSGAMMKSLLSPQAAVAYPEHRAREILQRSGLEVQQILYGNWCGRKDAVSFQDIVIVRKTDRGTGLGKPAAEALLRIPGERRSNPGLILRRALFDLPAASGLATWLPAVRRDSRYADWVDCFDTLTEQDILRIRNHMGQFAARPRFHLLVANGKNPEAVRATLASLRQQLYRNFTCYVLDGAGATDAAVIADPELKDAGTDSRVVAQSAMAAWLAAFNASLDSRQTDDWIMLLRAGDRLPAHALYWLACAALEQPDAKIVYSDDDAVDASGLRREPRFKPDWSPAHLRSTHYVGAAAILRGDAVAAAGGVSADSCRHGNYELLLRIGDASAAAPVHVPAVLFHRGGESRAGDGWEDPQWCASTLQAHLVQAGIVAEVGPTLPGCRRVRYALPEAAPPLVSIIVPTRDAVALLQQCVESVLSKTIYPRFEILVVDNQSADPAALAYLDRIAQYPDLRILHYDHPFNFSKINNIAAQNARGEVLCLLNNDTSVISSDWLEEMVGHLLQDGVGAVGAKLYYPDSRVQHVGVAVGPGGCADHVSIGIGHNEPGYCYRAVVAHELSAVTGACLVTWKHLYARLGGLDEDLAVGFNDVDYCLRVQEAGYRVIFTPHAELFHHESATRGRDDHKRHRRRNNREVSYIRTRWSERMYHDPYYNPNLSYRRPDFSLSGTPRVKKPWL